MPIFDHLTLDDVDRALIAEACGEATTVWLGPLDKGLSGADVWMAEWALKSGGKSKRHVFKIGEWTKLKREDEAAQFASTIEPGFPHMVLFPPLRPEHDRGLLRQEFVGDVTQTSLRSHVAHDLGAPEECAAVLRGLYRERMSAWHDGGARYSREERRLGEAVDRWGVVDLLAGAREMGIDALNGRLEQACGTGVEALASLRDELAEQREQICVGPVHGDLHSQNVLVGTDRLELIDYAGCGEKWRALDFLMMECSLKFLVVPQQASLRDLLALERALEPVLHGNGFAPADISREMFGTELAKIGAAVTAVREQAFELGAVESGEQYRRGLFMMTAGLAQLPREIHRPFLFHSLAFHAAAISSV